jgi:DNA-binding transcriptional MerR regulator/methylmalonyl-CoA mutase cobalamin-binding subunit
MNENPRDENTLPRHPIRVVAERTGVSPTLLRAWERRYHVVDPGRSEGGQRLYSDADVERVFMLKRASEAGRTIGSIAELSNDELRRLLSEDAEARDALRAVTGASGQPERLGAAMRCVEEMDPEGLERLLRREVVAVGADRFIEEVAGPLLVDIGTAWHEGRLRPHQEHIGVEVVRQVLGWVRERAQVAGDAQRIVIGTLSGEAHEMGAMMAATTAALEGWRVIYTGGQLPAGELALTAKRVGAAALGLSFVNAEGLENRLDGLRRLLEELPPDVAVLVGGRAAAEIAAGAGDRRVRPVPSLEELRMALGELG